MGTHNSKGVSARRLGAVGRTANDEARELGGGAGFGVQRFFDSGDFRCNGMAAHVELAIEGEAYACAYLERLCRGAVSPDDLAVLMAFLRGEMLNGACRVIEKALQGGRHG